MIPEGGDAFFFTETRVSRLFSPLLYTVQDPHPSVKDAGDRDARGGRENPNGSRHLLHHPSQTGVAR